MNLGAAAFLSFFLLQSCSRINEPIKITTCKLGDFTQARNEHIIENIREPIVVRSIKGIILNDVGGWPENCPILFEIRRIGKASKTIQVYADGEGKFEIPRVAKGHYCFKATVNGWRSVMGIIKVKRRADPKNTIRIVMLLGV